MGWGIGGGERGSSGLNEADGVQENERPVLGPTYEENLNDVLNRGARLNVQRSRKRYGSAHRVTG